MKNHQEHNQLKLDLLESISRERNLPVTIQRRVVLNALLDRDDHPTVDQLFEDVKVRMPGVSRTTIYRALETLVDLGLARRTNHFEASARFDGNTDHHHHLVCRRCNHVEDIDHPSLKKFTPPQSRQHRLRSFGLFHPSRRPVRRVSKARFEIGAEETNGQAPARVFPLTALAITPIRI